MTAEADDASVEASSVGHTPQDWQWKDVVWYNAVTLGVWHIGAIYALFAVIPNGVRLMCGGTLRSVLTPCVCSRCLPAVARNPLLVH